MTSTTQVRVPVLHAPTLRVITLGYHDVVEEDCEARAPAPGHSTWYTLSRHDFRKHLVAIRARVGEQAVRRFDAEPLPQARASVLITVDDGTGGAYRCAAAELDAVGWLGHFFITTNWIGKPGFVSRHDIRDLFGRGHVIGSHSCSHPERTSSLRWEELLREWSESCAVLSDIIGERVTVASVPGGYSSHEVCQAAAASGITVLFTSEPTVAAKIVDGCLVMGRYSVRRSTTTAAVAAIASGARGPRWRQAAEWSAKNAAKRVMGRWYLRLREAAFSRELQQRKAD